MATVNELDTRMDNLTAAMTEQPAEVQTAFAAFAGAWNEYKTGLENGTRLSAELPAWEKGVYGWEESLRLAKNEGSSPVDPSGWEQIPLPGMPPGVPNPLDPSKSGPKTPKDEAKPTDDTSAGLYILGIGGLLLLFALRK